MVEIAAVPRGVVAVAVAAAPAASLRSSRMFCHCWKIDASHSTNTSPGTSPASDARLVESRGALLERLVWLARAWTWRELRRETVVDLDCVVDRSSGESLGDWSKARAPRPDELIICGESWRPEVNDARTDELDAGRFDRLHWRTSPRSAVREDHPSRDGPRLGGLKGLPGLCAKVCATRWSCERVLQAFGIDTDSLVMRGGGRPEEFPDTLSVE